jgi:hypothetical protein
MRRMGNIIVIISGILLITLGAIVAYFGFVNLFLMRTPPQYPIWSALRLFSGLYTIAVGIAGLVLYKKQRKTKLPSILALIGAFGVLALALVQGVFFMHDVIHFHLALAPAFALHAIGFAIADRQKVI